MQEKMQLVQSQFVLLKTRKIFLQDGKYFMDGNCLQGSNEFLHNFVLENNGLYICEWKEKKIENAVLRMPHIFIFYNLFF